MCTQRRVGEGDEFLTRSRMQFQRGRHGQAAKGADKMLAWQRERYQRWKHTRSNVVSKRPRDVVAVPIGAGLGQTPPARCQDDLLRFDWSHDLPPIARNLETRITFPDGLDAVGMLDHDVCPL